MGDVVLIEDSERVHCLKRIGKEDIRARVNERDFVFCNVIDAIEASLLIFSFKNFSFFVSEPFTSKIDLVLAAVI